MSQTPSSPNSPAPDSLADQPGRFQKMITIALWGILLIVVLGVLIYRLLPTHPAMPVWFQASRFSLTDQNGNSFSAGNLRSNAYICDFIFTTCGSACPLMSHQMAEIQKQTPDTVRLVSFTVNPEHDTAAVLKEYGANFGADPLRWHFLTGTPEQMSDVAVDMKVRKPGEANSTVDHSELFFLVDGEGNVRGMYDRKDPQAMKTLIIDATWLSQTKGASGEK